MSWPVGPEDWSDPGTERIARTVLDHARTGSLILEHDGFLSTHAVPEREGRADRSQSIAALKIFLPRLLATGYRFTTPRRTPAARRNR